MSKVKMKKSTLNTILIVLACVFIFGAIFGLVSFLTKKDNEKTTTFSTNIYSIGGLTEQGVYKETTESIYTKNLIGCMGLKTKLIFDNTISYRIFFYDESSNFISATSKLTSNYDSSEEAMPIETKSCRIVITPNEDDYIKWYEVRGYAKQLSIIVNKNQKKQDGVQTLVNVFAIDSSMVGKYYDYNTSEIKTSGVYNTSTKVAVGNNTKLKVDFPDVSSVRSSGTMFVYYFDSTGNTLVGHELLDSPKYFTGCSETFDIPSGTYYVALCCYANCDYPAMYLF